MKTTDKAVRFVHSHRREIMELVLIRLDVERGAYVEFIDVVGAVVQNWFKKLPSRHKTADVFNEISLYVACLLEDLAVANQIEIKCAMQTGIWSFEMEPMRFYRVSGERKGLLRKAFGSIYESQGQ